MLSSLAAENHWRFWSWAVSFRKTTLAVVKGQIWWKEAKEGDKGKIIQYPSARDDVWSSATVMKIYRRGDEFEVLGTDVKLVIHWR